jgi:uncharacterized protein (DUF1330 family)
VRYSKADAPLFKKVGGTILWAGHVKGAAFGDFDKARWDWVVLAWFPSRAAWLDMMTSPEYAAANVERENGVEHHVILARRSKATRSSARTSKHAGEGAGGPYSLAFRARCPICSR